MTIENITYLILLVVMYAFIQLASKLNREKGYREGYRDATCNDVPKYGDLEDYGL